ncbi:ATP-binding protein [Aquimonas sp.]|uniref:ATP-binding protein n=1 Tax=Aquimonas sp. TaxID=1872588 RepID=UPI0037BF9310
MNLKPWREIAVPHEDVLKGTFQQAEFAADITRVFEGSATAEYQDPVLFFQRTYITEGMRLLLDSVVRRLAGRGGDPVIQLQTAFGGGKTHTMLAVLHLAQGTVAAHELSGVAAILESAGLDSLPKAKVAVLDGTRLAPNQPRKVDGHSIRTLWGELAWQLGGAAGYAQVADSDASGTSPGKDVLTALIAGAAPCVVLLDEMVAYIRQFEDGKSLSGGSFGSNLSFIQALTEAMKAVPDAVLLGSLPESHRETVDQQGIKSLQALEHYFARVQALWKPVATEEAFEIVRRRLFAHINDRAAADATCRAFADHYVTHAADLPGETQEGAYLRRMQAAYPIHPEVFERLYTDWSTLPNFQRTRGVLKLMAKVIHRLWQDGNQDLLLMPSSLPLYDGPVRTELTNYLPPGWDPVLEHDVDGERAEPTELDLREPRFGAVQACRRVTRCIFLGSAPTGTSTLAKGLETERVVLGSLQPGQAPHVYRDALGRLESRLTFLNKGNNRWWLDVRPNLRREMEERKRRFGDGEVVDAVRDAVQRVMGQVCVEGVHYFTPSADVPDDWSLRLVILGPNTAWTRSGPNPARDAAIAILRERGGQPRQRQNRLLFLAADSDQIMHLKDTVRALLAWQSIESDIRELRLNLDALQTRQATQNREQSRDTVHRLVRDTFKWLVAPSQSTKRDGSLGDVEWEAFALNPAAPGIGREVDRALVENELVINEWAPVHLHNLLKAWFWKDGAAEVSALDVWQKMCSYIYLPRLAKSTVMQTTIAAGATSRDFFGLATDKLDGAYRGFVFGKATTPFLDALLLIEPRHAAAYEEATRVPPAEPAQPSEAPQGQPGSHTPTTTTANTSTTAPKQVVTRFYATAELDAVTASLKFSTIVSELVELFSATHGTKVRIRVDIEAEDPRGFGDGVVRAAKENSKVLGMKTSEFE